jgi:hypothetical protein
MDSEKKIRIGVDAKELESTFDRIKKIAQETAAAMIQDAEKRTGSSRDMVKSLEDEIKLMERQQHMSTIERRTGVEDRLKIDPNDVRAQKELTEIKIDDKESKLHTELLRDIVDAILSTSRAEVDQDKKVVQESIAKTPHAERTFKQRYQAGLLAMEGDKLSEEQSRGGMFAGGMRGYGMAVIGARNAVDAGFNVAQETGGMMSSMGGSMAGAGIALALGSILGKKLWDVSMQYYKQAGLAFATTGRDTTDIGKGYSAYGYSAIDFTAQLAPLAKARRSSTGLEESARYQMMLKRGINLDESTYSSMDMLSILDGGTGYGGVQSGVAAMRAGGIVNGEDMSAVPDYLAIMIQLGEEQVSRLGKVDMGVNTKMVAALANMDDTLKKSPEALSTMINAVRGGLTGGGTPQQQALQYSVLSQIAPGASMFDLMKMKEDPFSEGSQKYLPAYLSQLQKMSGGKDDRFFMNIMRQFGLSASMSETLGRGFQSGNLQSVLDQNFSGKEGISGLGERATAATPAQEKLNADMINGLISTSDTLVQIGEGINKIVTATAENAKATSKVADEISAKGGIGNRIVGALVELSAGTWGRF